ncbi:Os02g0193933, partial [Oryza sativa Japonica Group]
YLICGPCAHFDIKFIFCGGGPITVACHWGPRASPRRCTAARAWRTPTKASIKFLPYNPKLQFQ